MTGPRQIVHDTDLQDIKVASDQLINAFGPQKKAAALTGYRQQRISDCGLINTSEFLPVDAVQKLESRTVDLPGWPHVTRTLARQQGFILVPAATAGGEGDLTDHLCAVSAEAGDVMRALADAERDGLTKERRGIALTQAHELQEAAAALIALLEGGK